MNWCTHLFIQFLVLVIMGMGICNDWNFTITLLILLAELFQFWSLYTLSDWLLNSFAKPPSFCIFSILFLFGITKYCSSSYTFPALTLKSAIFHRDLVLCVGEWHLPSRCECWIYSHSQVVTASRLTAAFLCPWRSAIQNEISSKRYV